MVSLTSIIGIIQYNHKNNRYNPYNPHHCIQMRANLVSMNSFLTLANKCCLLAQACFVADVQSTALGSSGSPTSKLSSNAAGAGLGISTAGAGLGISTYDPYNSMFWGVATWNCACQARRFAFSFRDG